jgi:hypothetical protein
MVVRREIIRLLGNLVRADCFRVQVAQQRSQAKVIRTPVAVDPAPETALIY